MKNTIGFLVGIIIIFSLIHWSGIYTNTIEKAVTKNGWDKPFLTERLNDETAISFIKEKSTIRVVMCSKGSFGWIVKGDSGAMLFSQNDMGFSEKKGTFNLKNKTYNYLFGIISDNEIDHITYITKDEPQEHPLNLFTTQDGKRMFYMISEKELKGVTYIAYSAENNVLK